MFFIQVWEHLLHLVCRLGWFSLCSCIAWRWFVCRRIIVILLFTLIKVCISFVFCRLGHCITFSVLCKILCWLCSLFIFNIFVLFFVNWNTIRNLFTVLCFHTNLFETSP